MPLTFEGKEAKSPDLCSPTAQLASVGPSVVITGGFLSNSSMTSLKRWLC